MTVALADVLRRRSKINQGLSRRANPESRALTGIACRSPRYQRAPIRSSPRMTSAIPPSTAAEASTSRGVIGSPSQGDATDGDDDRYAELDSRCARRPQHRHPVYHSA